MSEDAPKTEAPKTPEDLAKERTEAIAAFHECKTNEERKKCAEKYPVLTTIYAAIHFQ